jgi:hypothetical protein
MAMKMVCTDPNRIMVWMIDRAFCGNSKPLRGVNGKEIGTIFTLAQRCDVPSLPAYVNSM